jgi:hypothetical protein
MIKKCKNQNSSFGVCNLPTDAEVCFSTDWGGNVNVKLRAICYPNTPEVHSRVCWLLTGNSSNKFNGTYSNQPIDITLSPIDNHEYTLRAGLDANYDGYLQTSEATHSIKIKILAVKVTPEDAGGAVGAVPLTECMEERWMTYTANTPSWTSYSENIKYEFFFQRANGTNWSKVINTQSNSAIADWIYADYVSNSPGASSSHHYFDTEFYVKATYKGVTAKSVVQSIRVYRLYIMQFGDHAQSKHLKVCVGDDIKYEAVASSDCQNWYWEMPDGTFNAWNISSNKKSGTDIKIPYSDLARASNSWFGDAYGTVYVQCYDGDNNQKTFKGSKWIKVFFPPDVNVDGGTPTNDKPPCWFVFWKDGKVIDGMSNCKFDSGTSSYGHSDGTYEYLHIGLRLATQPVLSLTNNITNTPVTLHATTQKHLLSVAGTIRHEKYHNYCSYWWGQIGTLNSSNSDTDGLPDNEENKTNAKYAEVTLPRTDPNTENSYSGFPAYFWTAPNGTQVHYEDQEIRCRIIQSQNPMQVYPEKDWSACNENSKW